MIALLPTRPTLHEALPYFHPFGVTRAQHNALEGFKGSSPDLAPDGLKVLFLGCCDLRGPLAAASRPVHQNLEVHINNKSLPSIARSALILKVISSQTFDPEDETDMDYIWDLWYNTTWPESTLKRFMEDVKSLIDGPLPGSIIFPRSQDLEDLKNIWVSWLTMIQTLSVESVLNERSDVLAKGWTRQARIVQGNPLLEELSLSGSAIKATQFFEHDIRCDLWADVANSSTPLARKMCKEIHDYFMTGNCSAGPADTKTLEVNPTLLQPSTGKWLVYYSACPFAGYFPLPWKELESKSDGTALSHCRNELKKLLIAFRKQMDEAKFFFHPCDALALCYEEPLEEFDVIDTSDLSDHVGLANLLNAGARKLRSDHQSVLFTESSLWSNMACNLSHYVQNALYCPLSLIPTIYGLRLIDDVELGLGTIRSPQRMFGSSTRLRWTRVLPFGGVTLDPSGLLTEAIDQLSKACLFSCCNGKSSPVTPLTFRYVMSDFFRRAGVEEPNCQWVKLFSPETIPEVHRMSVGTLQAWMERRPVWRVKISLPFDPAEHSFITKEDRETIPVLRLILVPNSTDSVAKSEGNDELRHFIDNFDVKMRSCEEETIDQVDFTFLLEDRSLLDTHAGIVVNLLNKSPIFHIGKLSERHPEVDLFSQPYPWTDPAGTSKGTASSGKSKKLVIETFEEVDNFYRIVFHVLTERPQHPLQLSITPDRDMRQWPCESAHRITIKSDGFDPVVLTFPSPVEVIPVKVSYPIAECEKTTEHDIEVIYRKAPKDVWPEDVLQDRFRWNAEELQPWTKSEFSTHFHLMAQFDPESSFKRSIKDTPALGNIREKLLMMFHKVRKEGIQHFRVELKGSDDWVTNLQWFIRAHPPIRMSPQGVPILLLTAMDFRLMLRLKDLQRLDGKNCGDTLSRIIFDKSVDGSLPESFPIWLHSDEEICLFRYILRLNSTRMRPAPWHKENIAKEEAETPWLATFLQPLYLDSNLGLGDILRMTTMKDLSELGAPVCAHCRIAEEDMLKQCGRCKTVSYCSKECQRADWKKHKVNCSKAEKKKN